MRRLLSAAALMAAASTLSFATAQDAPVLQPVANLDIDRYQGLWHEMARYENPQQGASCLNATAEYGFNEDGNIAVVGTCTDPSGQQVETTLGTATMEDPAAPAKLSMTYGEGGAEDYWVVAVADDYTWSIVSEPTRERLWIMTRQPITGGPMKTQLIAKAQELGFDTSKLFMSQQGGINLSSSLETSGAY